MTDPNWFAIKGEDAISTPSLLVYPDRIQNNIDRMLQIAGSPQRLRPHIKTYKMAEIIQMQQAKGIQQFKAATLTELELLARCGVEDMLLAMQPVGPDVGQFFDLATTYNEQRFSCLVDCREVADLLAQEAKRRAKKIAVYIDVNNGMNRTGMVPGPSLIPLFHRVTSSDYLVAQGFHVYDGHLRLPNLEERKKACEVAFEPIRNARSQLLDLGFEVAPTIVGGSPTFPAHAGRDDVVLSPGTTLLWDAGYGSKFLDMDFQYAGVLATRLISKPQPDIFCLDLGHKSLASEMSFPRVQFLNTHDLEQLGQSEEHFVVRAKNPENYSIGDIFYAVPMHICPTVAKYPEVLVVKGGMISQKWTVAARDRKIVF